MMGTTLGLWAHAGMTPHVHGSAIRLVLVAGAILTLGMILRLLPWLWKERVL